MPRVLRKTLLAGAAALAVVAAACAEPPAPEVDLGSGERFVPLVADPLNDSGRHASVALREDGLPVVAYFGFQEELAEGEIAAPRPIGSPSVPGVMLATVSEEGFWTRGAIAIAEQIPSVAVAFNPAFEASVADLTPQNVTGLALATRGDTYHAAWASGGGVYHATGSLDPATTTQATVSQVSKAAGLGLSLAIDGDGTPWIAYYTSTSSAGSVDLATPSNGGWDITSVADGGACDTCRTAVLAGGNTVRVAYAGSGGGVFVAQPTSSGWTSLEVSGDGGSGLSGTTLPNGIALAFYRAGSVALASGGTGALRVTDVAEVAEGSAELEGARTAVAAGSGGELAVAWVDASEGVGLAVGEPGSLERVDTAGATAGGIFPSVAVSSDPARTYLGWYDPDEGAQDALVGAFGELGDLPLALPSPTPTEPIEPPGPPPSQECTPVEGGTVTVVAEGVAFTDGSCIKVGVGEPFTIHFDNQDAQTQHNVQIYAGPEPTGELLMEGEIITGPAQIDYDVPAFDAPGDYAYICVIHPTQMIGTVQVVEGGGGGGPTGPTGATGDGGPTADLTVTAEQIAFDTSTIELVAGQETTILFDNRDDAAAVGQHNIAIYEDDSLAVELFNGELISGPAQVTYTIPPLEPGEYYFLCIVHPFMNGTVVVA
jgi:plastocyanin